ncbi:hypothetical protein B0T14DRAFT_441010 [Immersiella caudata]|uniref:3-hydroxyisobutyrate dehydrogenase protein n=1 Tax=Immersiella caudata TaxID=314043 RepID=A0AA39TP59_9PEZI|nr:hypothetical protein B0T14DRAFT_441010 [Immersiella caudata]
MGETLWRWHFTHHFREPNCTYQPRMPPLPHRDSMGRAVEKPAEDRYIHALDGKLRRLLVQCTDDVFDAGGLATWRRTYVRKVSPLGARLATWVTDYHTTTNTWEDFWVQVLRTLPAAFAMMFFILSFHTQPDVLDLSYDAVHCKYLGDAKVWSNLLENRQGLAETTRDTSTYTLLRPRYLCLLKTDGSIGFTIISVEEWYSQNAESGEVLEYLFVAYSNEQFRNSSNADMESLHQIAEKATRDAGLTAFWVAGSCMPDESQLEDDIYRIADVVRGAKHMVVAVASPTTTEHLVPTPAEMLQQWGSRIWTFPELLLCPSDEVAIYHLESGKPVALYVLPKQQMGKAVWADAPVAQQLMDHYRGSINLSRLELAILALKCLYARQTTQWFPGDQSYALMGLLRLRPHIDRTDTAFQAFARVSLSNDSDRLLERYVCLLPKTLEQPWHCMNDQYESSPWDVEPTCQVAGVCHDNTIVLDGAHGACIRWKSFKPVWAATGPSFKRTCAQKLMEMSFIFFIIGVALLATAGGMGSQSKRSLPAGALAPYILPGVIFLLIWIAVVLLTPKLVRIVYGGKFHNVQARFFGIEGYLNPPTIERAIFGGAFGRLKWSATGSPLSLSFVSDQGEKMGMNPCRDANTGEKVETAKQAQPGQLRMFTLVDTYSMEVTLFEAVRPPTALFICGNEGGMQRAVVCSYDWTTQTFERETVLRIPTESLNRMHRVPRFKMGIVRKPYPKWVPGYAPAGNGSRV